MRSGRKAVKDAAVWTANGIAKGATAAAEGVADAAKWVFQKTGMKKVWNKIFHKKDKATKAE